MPAIFRSMFAINDINNGALSAVKSMPQKDITSDGDSSFAISRQHYMSVASQSNRSLQPQKKWYGNRDASQVTTNRRVANVGTGSLNASNALSSFTTYRDVNTVNDALTRVRAGGSTVPAKSRAKTTNAPTPSFPTGTLVRSSHRSVVPLSHYAAMSSKPVSANLPKLYH